MGKSGNRRKAAGKQNDKPYTTEQIIGNLKSKHRHDLLALMGRFDTEIDNLKKAHALEIEEIQTKSVLKFEEHASELIRWTLSHEQFKSDMMFGGVKFKVSYKEVP